MSDIQITKPKSGSNFTGNYIKRNPRNEICPLHGKV